MPTSRRPCSYSVHTHPKPPGPTLNAIAHNPTPDRAQRHTRQRAMCQRLAELGMGLAEAAYREALRELQPQPERRYPSTVPGLPDYATTPCCRSDIYGQLFALLSRCVRQAILLENRIEAGVFDHPRPDPGLANRAAAREPAPPSQSPPQGVSGHTRLDHERLEDEGAAQSGRSPEAILAGICTELQTIIDEHQLPAPAHADSNPDAQTAPANSPGTPSHAPPRWLPGYVRAAIAASMPPPQAVNTQAHRAAAAPPDD